MTERIKGNPTRSAELLGTGTRIDKAFWSDPMHIGPQTIRAALYHQIGRGSLVRYHLKDNLRNYNIVDIVIDVKMDTGRVAVMSGGSINDPNLSLQFANI